MGLKSRIRQSRFYKNWVEGTWLHRFTEWLIHPFYTLKHLVKTARPNINEKKYWDERYQDMDKWRTDVYESLLPLFREWEPDGRFSFLDVGCGLGDGCIFLKKHFPLAEASGADISSVAIEKASAKHPDAHFYVLDIIKDAPQKIYDYVIMVSVLEHLQNFRKAIENVLLSVKKALVIKCFYNEVPIVEPEHYHYFIEDTLNDYSPDVAVSGGRITYIIRPERLKKR